MKNVRFSILFGTDRNSQIDPGLSAGPQIGLCAERQIDPGLPAGPQIGLCAERQINPGLPVGPQIGLHAGLQTVLPAGPQIDRPRVGLQTGFPARLQIGLVPNFRPAFKPNVKSAFVPNVRSALSRTSSDLFQTQCSSFTTLSLRGSVRITNIIILQHLSSFPSPCFKAPCFTPCFPPCPLHVLLHVSLHYVSLILSLD